MERLTVSFKCFTDIYSEAEGHPYIIYFDDGAVLVMKLNVRCFAVCSVKPDTVDYERLLNNVKEWQPIEVDSVEDAIAYECS